MTDNAIQERVTAAFVAQFGEAPSSVIRAPGRVNLIGEHTDYNDGFVLPMAIDWAAWIALRPREDGQVVVHSLDFDQTVTFALDSIQNTGEGWAEYVKGMAWVMKAAGYGLEGWDGVMVGDVPIGAGLSSSAALELATARAFAHVSGIAWHPANMALLAQRAENEWVGVNCGIMDQMISAAGEAGHALLIDCRSLETVSVPLPEGTRVVVLDTSTRRGLVDSAYNERRQQCEAAAAHFAVQALRDVTLAQLQAAESALDPLVFRRARHVISENDRTQAAATAMQAGDAAQLGALMNQSHISMRDDFEISSDALNAIVEAAQAVSGCYGARMTGGGFAGCGVALVAVDAVEAFTAAVTRDYKAKTNLDAVLYVCQASAGAAIVG